MLRNHFIPHLPEVLTGHPSVEHNVNKLILRFAKGTTDNDNGTITYLGKCWEEVADEGQRHFKSSAAFRLEFIDHDHGDSVELLFPVSDAETINLNNGPFAEALLTDTFNWVTLKATTEYEDSTSGRFMRTHKRHLEVLLVEVTSKKVIHTFWLGDCVRNPKTANHTSSPQGENA